MNRLDWKGLGALSLFLFQVAACDEADPDSLLLLGTLERERIALTAPVTELLVERPVLEGQRLEPGALVARLDDRRLLAELAIHEAARARAQAQLAELEAGTTQERIAQAEAEHSGAVAAAASATSELRRMQKLFQDQLVPQSRLDAAKAASDQANAQERRTAQVLLELRRGARVEELDASRAALAEAEARIREAEVRHSQLELRTPVAAVVDELVFERGERPPAGAVVAILAAATEPFALVFVPERAVSRLKPGHPARVAVDGVADDLVGRFEFIATEAAFTPYYSLTDWERDRLVFRAKVEVTDPRALNLPNGVPARVFVELPPMEGAAAEARP